MNLTETISGLHWIVKLTVILFYSTNNWFYYDPLCLYSFLKTYCTTLVAHTSTFSKYTVIKVTLKLLGIRRKTVSKWQLVFCRKENWLRSSCTYNPATSELREGYYKYCNWNWPPAGYEAWGEYEMVQTKYKIILIHKKTYWVKTWTV